MKKRVVFKFTVFDESIKQIAKEVAREFPGVTKVKVVDFEGEGQLEVRGEFSTSELKNELMKIDEFVETFKIRPDGVTEPEVKIQQQQDEGKRPINIEEVFGKPSNDDASSSTWTGLGYGLWEQAKGVAVGAAEKAKDIGVGAVGLIEKEMKANAERKKKGGGGDPRKRFGGEELYPREKRGIVDGVKNYFERKKWQEEDRLRNEWMKKEDLNQKKMMQEHMRKHGLAKKSEGGTTQGSTATGYTGSLWNTIRTGVASGYTHTLRTGEGSGSTHTLRTGEASGSTQENRREEKRKKESAAKKGKNGN